MFSSLNMSKFESNSKNEIFFLKGVVESTPWDNFCEPKEANGVGLRNHLWKKKDLGAKLVWKMFKEPNPKWVRIIQGKYLEDFNPIGIFKSSNPLKGSRIYNLILKYRDIVSKQFFWDRASNPPIENIELYSKMYRHYFGTIFLGYYLWQECLILARFLGSIYNFKQAPKYRKDQRLFVREQGPSVRDHNGVKLRFPQLDIV